MRSLVRNTVLYFGLALPVWIFLQAGLALLFLCEKGPSACGVTFGDALLAYVALGVPMSLGALAHSLILAGVARVRGATPTRALALLLVPVIPLTPILLGWSPVILTTWHLTGSLLVGIVLYASIMTLPTGQTRPRGPAAA